MEVDSCSEEAQSILTLMKESRIYWQVRNELTSFLLKSADSIKTGEEPAGLLDQMGHREKLHGLISNCIQKSTRRLPIERDSDHFIETHRSKWSELLVRDFNNMASKALREEEYDEQDESVNYVYDCGSLLHFLVSLGHHAQSPSTTSSSEPLLLPRGLLSSADLQQLRSRYSHLLENDNLVGGQGEGELREREKRARRIVEGEHIASEIESFLSRGCSNGERVSVYRRYFECFYEYSGKRVEWGLYSKMWGQMVRSDAKAILKDPVYFVFKEGLHRMYQTFICDKQLGQMVRVRQTSIGSTPLHHLAPIHGVLPCRNFTHYMAPFCYCSSNTEEVYQLWRYVYANYFVLLNTISSLPDSILSLSLTFEHLLSQCEPELLQALDRLRLPPLQLVFPWMFFCFISYIPTEQFFLLLDRVIASKSLQLLPLYAVSVLYKYKSQIMASDSAGTLETELTQALEEDVWIDTVRNFLRHHPS